MKNRVVHFEIQVENPERAMEFYQHVFGWQFQKWGDQAYWVIMTAEKDSKEPGINGGMLIRSCPPPASKQGTNAYVCTIQVDSYDDIEKKIIASGGMVAMPKFALPGMAWQGYYLDTEGNTFGLHQADSSAK